MDLRAFEVKDGAIYTPEMDVTEQKQFLADIFAEDLERTKGISPREMTVVTTPTLGPDSAVYVAMSGTWQEGGEERTEEIRFLFSHEISEGADYLIPGDQCEQEEPEGYELDPKAAQLLHSMVAYLRWPGITAN